MEEAQIRKLSAISQFLLGLYGVGSFIVTGSLFSAFFAVGLGLAGLLTWFGI
jgi:hypothetical protein